jgi:hypothetical protein
MDHPIAWFFDMMPSRAARRATFCVGLIVGCLFTVGCYVVAALWR